jgi:phosphate transport system substrate-binding protein
VITTRVALPVALLVLSVSLLTACGSNTNSATSPSANSNISCATGSIKASGSTAQKNAMGDWINAYQAACTGATINYSGTGSAAGITDFTNNQTAFAGSDSALKAAQAVTADARCATGKAIDIPMVAGAIALAYNVPGVSKLILDPATAAKIFANKITKWNDPALVALNPGVTLPSASIAQYHRSDGSGTTDNFSKWLAAAAGSDWTFGTGKTWTAPGGQGSKGSDGVASSVGSTPNSIGYMELSFAQNANLAFAEIDNGAGAVTLTSDSGGQALAVASITGSGNDLALKFDYATKTAGVYPIVLVTYEITCEKGLAADQLALVKSFLTYTSSAAAQANLAKSGYIPLPAGLLTKVETAVAALA